MMKITTRVTIISSANFLRILKIDPNKLEIRLKFYYLASMSVRMENFAT